jgi:hypothetical protein
VWQPRYCWLGWQLAVAVSGLTIAVIIRWVGCGYDGYWLGNAHRKDMLRYSVLVRDSLIHWLHQRQKHPLLYYDSSRYHIIGGIVR